MDILLEMAEFIRENTVVDLHSLSERFPNRSAPSIHRDLAKLKCATRYTDNSRYYTLPDIPEYDWHGIWKHGGIMFSRRGTAKDTVRALVIESSCGLSPSELQEILGVRLYSPIKALMQESAITSAPDGNMHIFFSGEESARSRQQSSRANLAAAMAGNPFNLNVIIDVLLAVFLEKNERAEDAYRYLRAGKQPYVTSKEIEGIFAYYHLPGKKTEPEGP